MSRRDEPNRVVYLLHFDAPHNGKQHYLGCTYERRVALRMREHQLGNGSNVSRRFVQQGIGFRLAAVIGQADFERERSLKRGGSYRRWCPICRDERGRQPHLFTYASFAAEPMEAECNASSSLSLSSSSA